MNTFNELDIVALTQDRQTTHFETGKPITLYKGQVGTIVIAYDGKVFEFVFLLTSLCQLTFLMEWIEKLLDKS